MLRIPRWHVAYIALCWFDGQGQLPGLVIAGVAEAGQDGRTVAGTVEFASAVVCCSRKTVERSSAVLSAKDGRVEVGRCRYIPKWYRHRDAAVMLYQTVKSYVAFAGIRGLWHMPTWMLNTSLAGSVGDMMSDVGAKSGRACAGGYSRRRDHRRSWKAGDYDDGGDGDAHSDPSEVASERRRNILIVEGESGSGRIRSGEPCWA